jgi:GTP-binding protein HflX
MPRKTHSTGPRAERVYIAGIEVRRRASLWTLDDSLAELAELARSAGAHVVGSTSQRLKAPTQTYLGKGKIEELKAMAQAGKFDTLVCDDELAPSQQRNLEKALDGVKVIDRTALILDVFASRAQTREGRLQVELAQHEYLLPRLAGQWTHLERQRGGSRGGIGTRGPGETQIETDRRLVRRRVQFIKKELETVRRHRGQYRARRSQQGAAVASLVGYTNAGKSTLLNSLTKAGVAAESRLFSTLDPVTRKVRLASGRELLLTDTVGFIQKQPPLVVNAFRATLEEIEASAMILHVVDIAHPNAAAQAEVVRSILDELGLAGKPTLLVLNKADLVETDEGGRFGSKPPDWTDSQAGAVLTSGLKGFGLDILMKAMDDVLSGASSTTIAPGPVLASQPR